MPDNPGRLLKKAKRAFKNGERGAAAHYIDRILRQNYTHRSTWKLLYREYGSNQGLKEFKREFTEQYYPDKLDIISGTSKGQVAGIGQSDGGSLLNRILRRFRRPSAEPEVSKPDQKPQPPPPQPQESKKARITPRVSNDTPIKPKPEKQVVLGPRPDDQGKPEDKPLTVEDPTRIVEDQTKSLTPEVPLVDVTVEKPVEQTTHREEIPPVPSLRAPLSPNRAGNIRVLVVDDTPQTRETIIRSLSFQREIEIIAQAENGSEAITLSRQTMPDVVLMDINMPDMDGITATAGVLQEVPYAQVVILTVQDDPDYMRKAMMAGAHDFLTKPPALDDLLKSVQNAGKIAHLEKRKATQAIIASSGHSPALSSRGKIISVYSPKGGVGCSTITVNLAASLHNDETNVIVVDGNLSFGDIAELFNLQSQHTLFDLTMRVGSLDFQVVDDILVSHESGIHILAPPGPDQEEYINPEHFIDVMEFLRDLYPYVLVNTSSQLSETTIAALEISDLIVLLVTQDIPTVARVRKFMDTLKLLKIDPERVLVVLNQYEKQSDINPEIIGKSIKHEVNALIPKDVRVVVPSINRGTPFMLRSDLKPHPISRAVLDLATSVRQRLIKIAALIATSESA